MLQHCDHDAIKIELVKNRFQSIIQCKRMDKLKVGFHSRYEKIKYCFSLDFLICTESIKLNYILYFGLLFTSKLPIILKKTRQV